MLRVACSQRKRAHAPKTRTGCATCRTRHVKCGEERPCWKCVSTGRRCHGYKAQVSTVKGSRSSPNNADNVALQTSRPTLQLVILDSSFRLLRNINTEIPGTDQERRYFHYFRSKTTERLAGFYPEKFRDMLLQASHFEPAIRHAVVAIGFMHERFILNGETALLLEPNSKLQDFTSSQYTLAIQNLVKQCSRQKSPTMEACLISWLLFAGFRALQGSHPAAKPHCQSGAEILYKIVGMLNQWLAAYETYADSKLETVSAAEWEGARMLKVRRDLVFTSLYLLRSSLVTSESLWDDFTSIFERIASIAEHVVRLNTRNPSDVEETTTSSDMVLVGPLFETASVVAIPRSGGGQ